MMLVYCTLISLVVLTLLCGMASFTDQFKDNTLQRVGLGLLGFAAGLKAFLIAGNGYVESIEATCYIGASIFAVGTMFNPAHFEKRKMKCSQQSKHIHL